jgi:hypothetical protein
VEVADNSGNVELDGRHSLARIGLAAEGLFNFALALLVVQLLLGAPVEEAGVTGAAEQIGRQPAGQFLLIVLIAGLACLVVWRIVQCATGDDVEGSTLKDRAKYGGMAAGYLVVSSIAGIVLLRNWGEDLGTEDAEEEATALVLDWPGGQLLVGAAGALLIVVALVGMWEYGVRGQFMRSLDRDRIGPVFDKILRVVGRIGFVGRTMVILAIGVLVVIAALRHDPGEVGGMSQATSNLAQEAWGRVLLAFMALGLFGYAALRFIEAVHRRTSPPA